VKTEKKKGGKGQKGRDVATSGNIITAVPGNSIERGGRSPQQMSEKTQDLPLNHALVPRHTKHFWGRKGNREQSSGFCGLGKESG